MRLSLSLCIFACVSVPTALIAQKVVSNITYPSGATEVVGPYTIHATSNVVVPSSANVTYVANTKIILGPGFVVNGGGFRAVIESAPQARLARSSISSGAYLSAQTVSLTGPSGSVVRYTTDGSDPTATHGSLYVDPIQISIATQIKMAAFGPGTAATEVSRAWYSIGYVKDYTGREDSYIVPTGADVLLIKAWGGGGGAGNTAAFGGGGGFISAEAAVTSGQSVQVRVGGGGLLGTGAYSFDPISTSHWWTYIGPGSLYKNQTYKGVYGGGGDAWVAHSIGDGGYSGQGGGRTEVQIGTDVLIAGGGGGGSDNNFFRASHYALDGGGGGGGAGEGKDPGGFATQPGRNGENGDTPSGLSGKLGGGGGGGLRGGGAGHSSGEHNNGGGGGGGGGSSGTVPSNGRFIVVSQSPGGARIPGARADSDLGVDSTLAYGGGPLTNTDNGQNTAGFPGRVVFYPVSASRSWVEASPKVTSYMPGQGITLQPRGFATGGVLYTENAIVKTDGTVVHDFGRQTLADAFNDITSWTVQGSGPYLFRSTVADLTESPDGPRTPSSEGIHWNTTETIVSTNGNYNSVGYWSPLYNWNDEGYGFIAAHVVVLPTGKLLAWNRQSENKQAGSTGRQVRLWDPATPDRLVPLPNPASDIFCSSQILLSDGLVHIFGGHVADFDGTDDITLFDYRTNTFVSSADPASFIPKMNKGRWYPSVAPTQDGNVVVMLGSDDSIPNYLPQLWQPGISALKDLTSARLDSSDPATKPIGWEGPETWAYYPFMHLSPNGKIFISGPYARTYYLDASSLGSWSFVATTNGGWRGAYLANSVSFGPGKILITGGMSAITEAIDLTDGANPIWYPVAPALYTQNSHADATVLADGSVLVTGGQVAKANVMIPEIWNPNAGPPAKRENTPDSTTLRDGAWQEMAAMAAPRYYHSTAVLLSDARVLVAGGGASPDPGYPAQANAQIFAPPYLFDSSGALATRPVIGSITTTPARGLDADGFTLVLPGDTLSITMPDATQTIAKVSLVRLSSVTHKFNTGQNYNSVSVVQTGSIVTASLPTNANLFPPGFYMVFVINGSGVPSEAQIVNIKPHP